MARVRGVSEKGQMEEQAGTSLGYDREYLRDSKWYCRFSLLRATSALEKFLEYDTEFAIDELITRKYIIGKIPLLASFKFLTFTEILKYFPCRKVILSILFYQVFIKN